MSPYELRQANAIKHAEVFPQYEGEPRIAKVSVPDRGVRAHGEPRNAATRWSKNVNSSDVLPRSLRQARAHRFIPREGW